jgi:NAD(P)H-hydrate repair Nnr-like enzyme with NAD(P)H-hydrate dehydratase domain
VRLLIKKVVVTPHNIELLRIVAAILDDTLPDHVTLFDLASGTPLLWDKQRALLSL